MIAIIDYGAGNTASVANALEELNVKFRIAKTEGVICKAEKIIFPGVGHAASAVRNLHILNLFNLLRILKRPLLGICLGMQLFSEKSIEGDTACLGVLPVDTKKFDETKVTVPNMGWSKVKSIKESKLFEGLQNEEFFYFAHTYFVPINEFTIATANHDVNFTAAIEKNNFYGVQFHPEKSGKAGLQILENFVEKC
ncbi:MAG: imidazole glycerol phosphate synthase subunit HisH [Melioribacteraceae bacterium]|nr:imidazole glycerol phosphate synthase subunit HisH [Melioribacteraceae bacterium]MCF8265004.1 imidazole glycerol phosphate synthase subunit HisH [Melioribacteraceae bacterium]